MTANFPSVSMKRHKRAVYNLFAHFYTLLLIMYTAPFSLRPISSKITFYLAVIIPFTLCTSCGMKVLFKNHLVFVATCISF